jgi:hypothetical protein
VASRLPPDAVDGAVPGGGDQPSPGVRGQAGLRPLLEGGQAGLLDRFLGEVDVTEEADQGGDGLAPLLADDPLEGGLFPGDAQPA